MAIKTIRRLVITLEHERRDPVTKDILTIDREELQAVDLDFAELGDGDVKALAKGWGDSLTDPIIDRLNAGRGTK